jgi:hypothetical protein
MTRQSFDIIVMLILPTRNLVDFFSVKISEFLLMTQHFFTLKISFEIAGFGKTTNKDY